MIQHSPLKFEYLEGKSKNGAIMRLTEDLLVVSTRNRLLSVKVPKGMHTNGASIPNAAKSIIGGNFDGLYLIAAVVHDMLYLIQHPKAESDKIFYDLMLESNVSEKNAWMMWKAVAWFGSTAFNSEIPQDDVAILSKIKINVDNKAEYDKMLSLIALRASK